MDKVEKELRLFIWGKNDDLKPEYWYGIVDAYEELVVRVLKKLGYFEDEYSPDMPIYELVGAGAVYTLLNMSDEDYEKILAECLRELRDGNE